MVKPRYALLKLSKVFCCRRLRLRVAAAAERGKLAFWYQLKPNFHCIAPCPPYLGTKAGEVASSKNGVGALFSGSPKFGAKWCQKARFVAQ